MFPDKVVRKVNAETMISDVNKVMSYLFSMKNRKTSKNPGEVRDFSNTRFWNKEEVKELCKDNNMQ